MGNARRTLLWTGVLSVLLIALVARFDLLAWNGFANDLIRRRSAAGLIALVVLTVVSWVVLFALLRYLQGSRERQVIRQIQKALETGLPVGSSGLDAYLRNVVGATQYDNSLVRQRFGLLEQAADGAREDFLSFLLASQSGMDAARAEASMSPARALVWSLPALGFLGTASEMALAVGGLGESVARTTNYNDLRGFLVQDVIPPLANAFDVTLLALGVTVVSHLLLTALHSREQQILLEADAVALTALTVITASSASGRGAVGGGFTGNVEELASAIGQSSQTLAETNRRLADHLEPTDSDRLAALLTTIDGRLRAVVEALGRDLVLRRNP